MTAPFPFDPERMFFNNGMIWWKHAFRAPVQPSRTGKLHPNLAEKPKTAAMLAGFDALFHALEEE
jgi:hypothetical protein